LRAEAGFSSIEADFTTQLLYASIKSGVMVHIGDMGMNVLFDLLNFTAEIDNEAIKGADGKNIRKSAPMNLAEMTKNGKVRG